MPSPYQCVCSASGFGADELPVSGVPQFEVREGVPYLSPEYASFFARRGGILVGFHEKGSVRLRLVRASAPARRPRVGEPDAAR